MTTPCIQLFTQAGTPPVVDYHRFDRLHRDGQSLVRTWFHRAARRAEQPECDKFEAFIYLWIALNSWAACVTEEDKDSDMVWALAYDPYINQTFESLRQEPAFEQALNRFYAFWPVFRAQDLRKRNLLHFHETSRSALVQRYLAAGVRSYQPRCYEDHQQQGGECPRDWPHALRVIYTVRCNLFHGDKGRHSEMDTAIVNATFDVLFPVFAAVVTTKHSGRMRLGPPSSRRPSPESDELQ